MNTVIDLHARDRLEGQLALLTDRIAAMGQRPATEQNRNELADLADLIAATARGQQA